MTVESEVQSKKAASSMVVTDGGIVMVESEVQPEKAHSSMVVTDGGILMVVRNVQPLKAPSLIAVTVDTMTTSDVSRGTLLTPL